MAETRLTPLEMVFAASVQILGRGSDPHSVLSTASLLAGADIPYGCMYPTLLGLVRKKTIKRCWVGSSMHYRITEEGIEAVRRAHILYPDLGQTLAKTSLTSHTEKI